MRKFFKVLIRSAILVLSIESFFFVFSDLLGSWQGVKDMMARFPNVAAMLKGPLLPLLCLVVCLLAVYGEKFLRSPDLRAEYLRVEVVPRIGLVPVRMLDEIHTMIAKRETYTLPVDVFVEIYLVNYSEYKVTIRDFAAQLLLQRPRLVKYPWLSRYFPQQRISLTRAKDFAAYRLKTEKTDGNGHVQTAYDNLQDIETKMQRIALERGIGYTGWIGFSATVDRKALEHTQIRVTVRDALGNTHPVEVKDKTVGNTKEYENKLIPPL